MTITDPVADTVTVTLPGHAAVDVPASHAHYLITVDGAGEDLAKVCEALGWALGRLAEAGVILPGFQRVPDSDPVTVQVTTPADPRAAEQLFDAARALSTAAVTVTATHTSWGLSDTSQVVDGLLARAAANARERAEAHAAGQRARDIREIPDPARRLAEVRVSVDGTIYDSATVRVQVSTAVQFAMTPAIR